MDDGEFVKGKRSDLDKFLPEVRIIKTWVFGEKSGFANSHQEQKFGLLIDGCAVGGMIPFLGKKDCFLSENAVFC